VRVYRTAHATLDLPEPSFCPNFDANSRVGVLLSLHSMFTSPAGSSP